MKMLKKNPKVVALLMGSLMLLSSCSEDDDVATEAEILPPIVLDCDYFKEDRILENDPQRPVDYIVTCWARVQGSLKIEAGVVIEFENHAGLRVDLDNNVFEIKGTSSEPVILSGTSKQKGYWRGIFLSEAHNPNNLIEHTVIEYAGSQNLTGSSPVYEGSLAIRGSSGTTPQALTLNHVEISNGGSVGIDYHGVRKQNSVATSNLIITGNEDVPVKVSAEMAHIFDSSSSYSGNASDFLNITTSSYEIEDQTVTWEKLDVPYLVDGRVHGKKNGHLTIEAGVEIQFRAGAYLQFSPLMPTESTSFKIKGTADNPVYLKAHNGTNWGGIYWGYTDELSSIDYAIIENAKGDFSVGNLENTGAIYLWANPHLTVTNTLFKNLPNCTFYEGTGYNFENLTTENLTFENTAETYCTP